MSRGSTRRTWVKLHITGWLHGSIRWQLTPEERGVWADLIALAGECGNDGQICDNDGRPYPLEFIAGQLNISLELLERTIKKCQVEGRINNNLDLIAITNWKAYQSEYERQKQYRKKEDKDYKAGAYGGNVAQTAEDVERIKKRRAKSDDH